MNTDQNPYPNIIDNKHQKLEGVLKELLTKSEYAKIVSGYFYIEGFNLVSRFAQDTKADIVIGIRTTKATKEEFEEEKLLELSERQKKIIEYLKENNRITRSACMQLLDVSKDTALRELSNLKLKNIIKQEGVGRGIYYMLR
ncbi:MAG: hypothetical protein A7316_02720 [Candidatus Altiarchaeales archaeon WOR_SM1_86-2]|nr:MAG: hypothetical protein A7316_02720 [Candidatus Altiarchaeales archaeon WOR_SM1_86-2]ODS40421.1 MAG: hypothetical protein A7315_08535 [Candidatus Altiarchaeales archaeon WOR_SM1_79]